jgi:hypothetical protein
MSDRPVPKLPEGVLTEEQVAKISGGDCTISDIKKALEDIRTTYDSLVDFTSYVIERVVGP